MRLKNSGLPVDKVLSISAIVIALASVFVSIWEGMETRRHNRLAVKLKLEIFFNVAKNAFGCMLINNGLGPAIITERRIFIAGAELNDAGISVFNDFFSKLNLTQDRILAIGTTGPGTTIRAGETEKIIELKLLPNVIRRNCCRRFMRELASKFVMSPCMQSPFNVEFHSKKVNFRTPDTGY